MAKHCSATTCICIGLSFSFHQCFRQCVDGSIRRWSHQHMIIYVRESVTEERWICLPASFMTVHVRHGNTNRVTFIVCRLFKEEKRRDEVEVKTRDTDQHTVIRYSTRSGHQSSAHYNHESKSCSKIVFADHNLPVPPQTLKRRARCSGIKTLLK